MFTVNRSIYKLCLLAALLSTIGFTACRKELAITPEVFVSPEQLYKDEAGAMAGLTGVYRQMLELKRSDYYFIGIVGTDEGKTSSFVPTWGGYWTHYTGINSYGQLLTPQNDLVQGIWSTLYKGISNANVAIRFIPQASAADPVKNRLIGEAKFLRAAFYFNLVQLFGGVPMPTDVKNPEADANGHPRSPEADVYGLIISDLQFGVEHLNPKGPNAMNIGRATKEAAMTLLGKVYLTRKEYALAKTTLEPLMTATNVRLMTDYADLFKETKENNEESIFEVQFSNENGNTNSLANTLGGWHIQSTYPGGGGHVVIPTDYYANSFESNLDKRKDVSIRYKFYDANGAEVDYWWWADVTKPHVKKFDITTGISSNSSESSRNIYYLRYADAILMYAEVQNELNDVSAALANLNKIRTRAGLANWETILGHVPAQGELRAEILKERMRELGFEGWRWFDLKRTGNLLSQTISNNIDAAPNMVNKHLLLPISAKEFETNAALKPLDQNAGY